MTRDPERNHHKHQKQARMRVGYMATGIALGLIFGVALSVAVDNFAFLGVGIAIGTALGAAFSQTG